MRNRTLDRYKDTDLGSFCQPSKPPTTSPEAPPSDLRTQPDHVDEPAHEQPPTVPLHPPSASDGEEVLAARQTWIEQFALEVWDENEELFIAKGPEFRKDFAVKVLERLVPPEFRKNFNYETIEAALPFLCRFEDPDRALRNLSLRRKIRLPVELREGKARKERLYGRLHRDYGSLAANSESTDTETEPK